MRLPAAILKCRLTRTYKPLVVLFYMTDRCNLKCRYCVGNWSARNIKDFTTEEIFKVVDECKELGTCHFTIHGGEVLLREDIKEIIDYMKKRGFYVNLVTNGILLPEKIDQVMGVDSMCISLDGRKENNDYTRGPGAYEAAVRAIRLAKERKLKFVVHGVLTRRTVADSEYLCKLAKEIGYYQQFSLLLKPLQPSEAELGLNEEESWQALLELIRLKRAGYPVFTSYRVLQNALEWPFGHDRARVTRRELHRDRRVIRCFYGRLKLSIDANGVAYPCSSLNDTFRGLNVKEVGVRRAFEQVLKHNDCEACFYLTQNDWSLLLGGSMRQFLNQARVQVNEIFSANL